MIDFSLRQNLESVVQGWSLQAEEKGLKLSC
jgi:hypothetical protein